MSRTVPKALTIAGSDSGGCAGIQADLKTFAALGVHGASVVTAVTAQNTRRVTAVHPVPASFVIAQMEAVLQDIGAAAVKSGMFPGPSQIRAAAAVLRRFRITQYVLDPVMVATSGARLSSSSGVAAMRRHLLPLALLATPNRYEAEILSGRKIRTPRHMEEAARAILDLGPRAVLIKGGHMGTDAAVDLLLDQGRLLTFSAPRVPTRNTHGAGCTLAAAVTAFLALGRSLPEAVAEAKRFVTRALRHSFSVGGGPGPLGHFHAFWP